MTSTINKEIKPVREQTNKVGMSKLIGIVVLSLVVSGVSTLFILVNILYTRSIAAKRFPTLVQTTSGEVINIEFEDPDYRSPEVIKKFVVDTMYYLMTMTSYSPGDKQLSMLDPDRPTSQPMKVGTGQITQSAWLATESLEGSFAEMFREQLAEMTPATVFQGTEEVILKYRNVEMPVEVTDLDGNWTGEWTVDVVADLKIFRKGDVVGQIKTETIAFNKRVTVVPIDRVEVIDVEEFGTLAVTMNNVQQSGLQITNIKDL